MFRFNNTHKSILETYSKPIVHMRKQLDTNRFGLMFGAGLSHGFKIPTWQALIDSIAEDSQVQGEDVLDVTPPHATASYQTEMLFEHFKQKRYLTTSQEQHNTRLLNYQIIADWREIIRRHLYANISDDIGELLDAHPYLKQYLPIIRRTHMTVTYNFDDFLELALLRERVTEDHDSRGFESVTNPWMQFRRMDSVIFHPNGVVPQNSLETPSDHFVFSEASYAKQLIGIFAGDQAGLVNHMSKHTCLLIGLSLEDDTLRNVLMKAAHSCPGNFHYYVHFLKSGKTLDIETMHAITQANFKVYNLITLFMHDEEIRALGELINIDRCRSNEFCDYAEQHNIRVRFRFYIIGALGVGKSTTVNHFRNLTVLDEWLEQRPPILAESWDMLNDDEKRTADEWVIDQFKQKNDILRNRREGIFLLDRGPLDPISFTLETEWGDKASRLLTAICPDQAHWLVEDGRVVLLEGESSELALRMVVTKRDTYTAEKLQNMEEQLRKIYGAVGVVRYDTRGLTPSDVAHRMGEIIHLEQYTHVCDLHNRLNLISEKGSDIYDL